jgi:DNA modification methylase
MSFDLHLGDCLDTLRGMPDNSIDSIVTDPPYGLSFMGKRWDYDVPSVEIWAECLRVLKPGGHLLAFAGTRTQHRMAVRIEDAGFEIRDMIAWVYGSGFPKSMDVSKAIDKAAGAKRDVVSASENVRPNSDRGNGLAHGEYGNEWSITAPATEAARQWQGWGTTLKPALEPITVARKPLAGTVAENVLAHGTGALNIDGCRVGWPDGKVPEIGTPAWGGPTKKLTAVPGQEGETVERAEPHRAGRWPANLIHDGSDEVVAGFPDSNGSGPARRLNRSAGNRAGDWGMNAKEADDAALRDAGTGSAARFFYCAKASKRDRDEGLEHMEAVHRPNGNKWTDQDYRVTRGERPASAESGPRKNTHPTVKPTDLMRYLCRLVTPPGGVVLDPFMGSGSTGKAAMLEGFRFIGCEMSPEYLAIANARITHALWGDLA